MAEARVTDPAQFARRAGLAGMLLLGFVPALATAQLAAQAGCDAPSSSAASQPAAESRPNPLARLPFVGRFFGDPTVTDGSAGGRVSPRYRLEVDAPSAIESLIREHTLLGRWRQRADYDESQLPLFIDRAPAEVTELVQAEGYFSPQVSACAIDGGARVTVNVGPRTRVESVDIEFDGEIDASRYDSLRADLTRNWLMPPGEAFRSQDWDRAKRALLDAVRDRGFLRARIADSEAEVNTASRGAALSVQIDSGMPLRFGELDIQGLDRYPPDLIQGLRSFKAGDLYDAKELTVLQTRLNGAGWFNTVSVRPDTRAITANPDLQEVPIRVDVIERQSKRLLLGGGWNADYGPSLLAGWEHRNVGGRGIQTFNGIEIDPSRQYAFSTWDWPQNLEGYRWQAGVRFEHRDIENDLVDAGSVFVARLRRRGNIETGWSMQYQDERQNIVYSPGVEDFYRNRALVLGWSWTIRDLDSPLAPTRGTIASLQLSGASDSVGSETSFFRAYALAYRIIPLSIGEGADFGRIVLRGELGHVWSDIRLGIPSANLFRTGGARSVRGYSSQSLGVSLGEATVGGRFLATGSIEYQHVVFDRDWALAVFADVGNASDSISDFKAVAGAGVGLRWRTPVGPLNIDIARGFDPGQWRLYVSIGVVF
jgi:translocation and assembly module TamA